MKFSTATLPKPAREKLLSFELAKAEAEDSARATQARIANLQRDADPMLVERLNSAVVKHRERHESLAALVNNIRQFLNALPPHVSLETALRVDVKLTKGEKISDAVGRVRQQIVAAKNHLRAIQLAPLPVDELKAQAAELVKSLAARAPVRVSANSTGLKVAFTEPNGDDLTHHSDVAALLAFLAPELLLRTIETQIETLPALQPAIPAQERTRRVAELEADLDRAEREEETLLDLAAQSGLQIERRPNAAPLAVLQIQIASAKAAAAA